MRILRDQISEAFYGFVHLPGAGAPGYKSYAPTEQGKKQYFSRLPNSQFRNPKSSRNFIPSVRLSISLEMDIIWFEVEFAPFNRDLTHLKRGLTPLNRGLTPSEQEFSRLNRDLTPLNRDLTLSEHGFTPLNGQDF
jgi:hypothetical protein